MVNINIPQARRHSRRQLTLVPGEPITGLFFTFTPLYPSFIHSTEAAEPTPVAPASPTTKKADPTPPPAPTPTPKPTPAPAVLPTTPIAFPTGTDPTTPLSYTGLASPTDTSGPSGAANGGPAVSSATSKGGISGGGVAAIVIVFLIIFLGGAAFYVRRRALAKRRQRTTWGDDFQPRPFDATAPAAPSEKSLPYAFASTSGTGSVQQPNITPPPMSYNNPVQNPVLSSAFSATTASPSTRSTAASRAKAIVQCTFIPSMHDELSINTGEVLTIESEYDDGWALCSNSRGEQGMVPLECLKKIDGTSAPPTDEEADPRSLQRGSSLLFREGVRY